LFYAFEVLVYQFDWREGFSPQQLAEFSDGWHVLKS